MRVRKIVVNTAVIAGLIALSACGGEAPADEAPASGTSDEAATTPEAAPVEVAYADLTGDAAKGEVVFGQCRACHMVEPDKNGMGPTLHGIVGRPAGAIEGFTYSDANKNAGITWDAETLYAYLENPREYLPGNRMAFPGLKDPQDRADVIAYLATQGG